MQNYSKRPRVCYNYLFYSNKAIFKATLAKTWLGKVFQLTIRHVGYLHTIIDVGMFWVVAMNICIGEFANFILISKDLPAWSHWPVAMVAMLAHLRTSNPQKWHFPLSEMLQNFTGYFSHIDLSVCNYKVPKLSSLAVISIFACTKIRLWISGWLFV